MKKIFNIASCVVLGSALITSCDINTLPTFDDDNAFVEFNNSSMTVVETAGELSVPITYSSLAGLTGTLSIEVVDGTAVSGTNFELDGASTVSFTAEAPTQYIKIKILDPGVVYTDDGEGNQIRKEGEYTGDLKFSVKIKEAGDLNLGITTACTITITDTDHPLTAILGDYSTTSTNGAYSSEWTMGLYKDADDDHKVWIDNIFANSGWADEDTRYYATIDEDLTTITVPLGQESEYHYSNGNPVTLYGLDIDGYAYDTGSVVGTITIDEDGTVTIDFGEDLGFYAYIVDAGYVGYCYPGVIAVK